ncbi:MAG: hypothetical protein K2W95_25680 [Candidatus Obscuribacterales bacterium]|nr:hypothetical protein [Candidatus Obscuribacterales bacterium]
MFDKFSDAARAVLTEAYRVSLEFKSRETGTDHLLLAFTCAQAGVPGEALASMNVRADNLRKELERQLLASSSREIVPVRIEPSSVDLDRIPFTDSARVTIKRAGNLRLFFGHSRTEPEHLMLAALDLADEQVFKVLDELGANTTYLYRLVVSMLADRDALNPNTPGLRKTIIEGLDELIGENVSVIEGLERLATASSTRIANLPGRGEVAHLVFISYLPDFLFTQLAYQRYLLEETLGLLRTRVGNLDSEFAAGTVSAAAQNVRSEVRATIEYFWSNEFKLLSKLPDEADYDLIGSVIEDLWWTHSEEVALNEVFDEALDDHRRKQMLNLQKRRVEISHRFTKLRARLEDTIKQCFAKVQRSISA